MGRWFAQLVELRPAAMGRLDNLRLVAPVYVGLIGFTAVGRFLDGMLVALGAYIVLFGAGQPGRRRFWTFLTCAGLLCLAVTCGVLSAGHLGRLIASYLGVAALAVVTDIVFPLGPPGPFFFVLMVGGGTLLAGSGIGLAHIVPLLVLGGALATVFALGDLLYDRYGAEERAVAGAAVAVAALRQAVEPDDDDAPAPAARVIDQELAQAADAIARAWATLLAGGGSTAEPARIEHRLREIHHNYRQLYLATLARAFGTDPHSEAVAIAMATPGTGSDVTRTALGQPSLRYRLRSQLSRPSLTLVTAARVCAGVVVATVVAALIADAHPFWVVLVVLLVLSYAGDQYQLTVRAVQRLLGTVAGIVVFAAVMGLQLPTAGLVTLICVLLWIVSRFTARNYLLGSFFITLLALYLVVPLTPQQSPASLAANRLLDTAIGVAIALTFLWLIGPVLTAPLTSASIRRITGASVAVLDDLSNRRRLTDPTYVEHRRQLQNALMASASALTVASTAAAHRNRARHELEQAVTRLGYAALGESWRSTPASASTYAQSRDRLHDIVRHALTGQATPEHLTTATQHVDALWHATR